MRCYKRGNAPLIASPSGKYKRCCSTEEEEGRVAGALRKGGKACKSPLRARGGESMGERGCECCAVLRAHLTSVVINFK